MVAPNTVNPPIQISGLKMPRGIAIDWVAGNVYWTDSGRDVIEVAQMKGENRKTLISGMIDEPHAIVVDPLRGWAGLWGRHLCWDGWGPSTPGVLFPSQTSLGLNLPQTQVFPPASPWHSPVCLCPGLPAACSDRGLTSSWLAVLGCFSAPGGGSAHIADSGSAHCGFRVKES